MTEQDSCRSCVQKGGKALACPTRRTGRTSPTGAAFGSPTAPGRSLTVEVCLAFLLPLVVFIASLATAQKILAGMADAARTAVSLALALASTFGCILIVRMIKQKICQSR